MRKSSAVLSHAGQRPAWVGEPPADGVCRTPEDCFAAGWADGADDKPLTATEIARMVALHAPYLRDTA